MTKWRERSREIKEAGEAERGNWTPEEGSIPLRLYQYWASNNPHRVPNRENFCHYWRVVAIWAPWFWVRRGVSNFMATRTAVALFVLAYIAVAVLAWQLEGAWGVTFAMAVVPWVFFGFVGAMMLYDEDDVWYKWPLVALTFPISLSAYGVAKLHDAWTEEWTNWIFRAVPYVLIPLGVVAVLAVLTVWTMSSGFLDVLLGLGIGAAVGLVLFGLFIGGGFLGDWISAKRRVARDKRAAMELEDAYAGRLQTAKPREPGRIRRFFWGVGDFLVLLGQVIRVNKWKICPIVEIPQEGVHDAE